MAASADHAQDQEHHAADAHVDPGRRPLLLAVHAARCYHFRIVSECFGNV